MTQKTHLLTKTGYLYGLQCDKLFWMYQNKRELLPVPDAATQAIFDQGHLVGDWAKTLYPGGREIDWSAGHEAGIAQTRAALPGRKALFEAGFQHGKMHARADILKPAAGGRWDLIEVKSSSRVKDDHIPDVAFQKHVYEGAGIRVRRCYVMHIDTSYVRAGEIDADRLFQVEEVTQEVKAIADEVKAEARRMLSVMAERRCPEVEVGPHCAGCALYSDCWSFMPERHVFHLIRAGDKSYELMGQGILAIRDIPDSYPLTPKQSIQVACEKTGRRHVDPKGIRAFLDGLQYPLYFLDFETFAAAVPPYDLLSPYENVPFEYSLHVVESPGGRARHHSFLSDGSTDPRPEMLSRLRAQLGKKGSIIAYNAAIEKGVLASCAGYFPKFAAWFDSIRSRIVDLYVPFRDFRFYHPDQNGRTSLKDVLPVLAGRSYEGLAIADGITASLRFSDLAFGNLAEAEKQQIRKDLEAYCHQDTEGMVCIVRALHRQCR